MSIPILDSTYDGLAWGSHMPVLMAALGATSNSRQAVIELGVGHFSTPALHAYCRASGRYLVSVEDNPEWYEFFRTQYQCAGHQFNYGQYDLLVPVLAKERPYDVAFIDNSPGGARRANDFKILLPLSTFVIVHDYWRDNEEAISPLLNGCHHYVYTEYEPPTLIASMTKAIPWAIQRH